VVALSAEHAARDPELAHRHVLATARAVASAADVRKLTEPLLAGDGVTLVFTGAGADAPPDAVQWAPGLTIMRKS
jgi:16S rRNA G527 N7-methylase RsmG